MAEMEYPCHHTSPSIKNPELLGGGGFAAALQAERETISERSRSGQYDPERSPTFWRGLVDAGRMQTEAREQDMSTAVPTDPLAERSPSFFRDLVQSQSRGRAQGAALAL